MRRILFVMLLCMVTLSACNTPIDDAVEWGEEQTDKLSEELSGD